MLLSIYLSLNLFTLISTTTQSDNSLVSSCFNFTGTRNNKTNRCFKIDPVTATYEVFYRPLSMRCRIEYTDIEKNSLCLKDLNSLELTFENNFLFERFFKNNGDGIASFFPTSSNPSYFSVLDIIVETYDIREITSKYINSTLNMHDSQTRIFLWFKKHLQDLSPLRIADEPYPIKFQFLSINIACDDGSWIHYMVNGSSNSSNKRSKIAECSPLPSTKQVSSLKFNSM